MCTLKSFMICKKKFLQLLEKTFVNLVTVGKDLLGKTPKAQPMKDKIDKPEFIKIKILFYKKHC